jgi:hypothetical protein
MYAAAVLGSILLTRFIQQAGAHVILVGRSELMQFLLEVWSSCKILLRSVELMQFSFKGRSSCTFCLKFGAHAILVRRLELMQLLMEGWRRAISF